MSKVWEDGPQKQGPLLVLLALSDYANDTGKCWPSIRSIAAKARMTERGTQKVLRSLESDGWIDIMTGTGRGGCNVYTIHQIADGRSARAEVSDIDRIPILRSGNHTCYYCGYAGISRGQEEGADLDIDHVIPSSKGGSSLPSNLVVACKNCNQSKKAKTPSSWASYMTGNPELYSGEWRSDERFTPEHHDTETPNVDAETPNVDTPEPSITINEPSIDNMSLGLFGDDDKPKEKFRLPDGWVPDADMTGYALSKSLNNDEIERIADDFFAYWDDQPKSKSTKSIRGWRSTWKNRIDAVAWRFIKNRNGGSIQQPRGSATSQEWSNSIANEIADAARSR